MGSKLAITAALSVVVVMSSGVFQATKPAAPAPIPAYAPPISFVPPGAPRTESPAVEHPQFFPTPVRTNGPLPLETPLPVEAAKPAPIRASPIVTSNRSKPSDVAVKRPAPPTPHLIPHPKSPPTPVPPNPNLAP